MRLLNSVTLLLEEFDALHIPRYAILSHTWEHDEVQFADMEKGTASTKAGYAKIVGCARKAAIKEIPYVWIDTCCIDKSSSAELSESINSMYRWYRDATVCFVYLADVQTPAADAKFADVVTAQMQESRWFTRGWTLQELIAPKSLQFYSSTWHYLGEKNEFLHKLEKITGIDASALQGRHPSHYTAARKMSWASKRQTTRKEDVAYCLLGIFDINMPLLYGEGERAFLRLQEEIIKSTDDQSLFAWRYPDSEPLPPSSGLLASHPRFFAESARFSNLTFWNLGQPASVMNRAIRASLFLIKRHPTLPDNELYRACLGCTTGTGISGMTPTIYLAKISDTSGEPIFCRVKLSKIELLDAKDKRGGTNQTVYVTSFVEQHFNRINVLQGLTLFWFRKVPHMAFPEAQWDPQTQLLWTDSTSGKIAAVLFDDIIPGKVLILGFAESSPWCQISDCHSGSHEEVWNSYEPSGQESRKHEVAIGDGLFACAKIETTRILLRDIHSVQIFTTSQPQES